MSNTSAIVVGTLFGIFIVTAWNLAMIEKDNRMLDFYCQEFAYCSDK